MSVPAPRQIFRKLAPEKVPPMRSLPHAAHRLTGGGIPVRSVARQAEGHDPRGGGWMRIRAPKTVSQAPMMVRSRERRSRRVRYGAAVHPHGRADGLAPLCLAPGVGLPQPPGLKPRPRFPDFSSEPGGVADHGSHMSRVWRADIRRGPPPVPPVGPAMLGRPWPPRPGTTTRRLTSPLR